MPMRNKVKTYRLGDCRESITGIGVVWPVWEICGRCGCGAMEMKNRIAFFVELKDAEEFVARKNQAGGGKEP